MKTYLIGLRSLFIMSLLTLSLNSIAQNKTIKETKNWPNGAQLVISVSMQFETGGQPEGAESPFSGNPLP